MKTSEDIKNIGYCAIAAIIVFGVVFMPMVVIDNYFVGFMISMMIAPVVAGIAVKVIEKIC